MKKYYLSHIDFSEIINVTADEKQIENAKARMTELGLLTEKGNPSTVAIGNMTVKVSKSFFNKLDKKMRRRPGGVGATKDILQKLCYRKDYYGFFLYVAFLYGFLEWQVPESVTLLPAVPDALKCYCIEFVSAFAKYLEGVTDKESEKANEDGDQTNI